MQAIVRFQRYLYSIKFQIIMKADETKKEVKKTLVELEKYAAVAKEKLRYHLSGLPPEEMISKIKELNLSDKSLNFLCEGIALETEDYEICAAVQTIKKERGMV